MQRRSWSFRLPLVTALAACGLAALLAAPAPARAGAADDALASYRSQGAGPFDAARGQAMWTELRPDPEGGAPRSCATCHTDDLRLNGKHVKTGKMIDPMAPSANPQRLTDLAKIEKWFKRNCDWTVGRECTPQEKGDFLSYIRSR